MEKIGNYMQNKNPGSNKIVCKRKILEESLKLNVIWRTGKELKLCKNYKYGKTIFLHEWNLRKSIVVMDLYIQDILPGGQLDLWQSITVKK